MKVSAILFDLDGTLIDTETAWAHAVVDFVKGRGCNDAGFDEVLRHISGRKWTDIDTWLHRRFPGMGAMNLAEDSREMRTYYPRHAGNLKDRLITGTVAFAAKVSKLVPCAIVSGAPREDVVNTAKISGLDATFKVLVGAEDYRNGKPNPEGFLLAALRLGVDPSECVVVEDSSSGVQAGVAAGMRVIGLDRPVSIPQNLDKATWRVRDLSAFDLAELGLRPNVIIDTDLGGCVDDLFAIDLAARYHLSGSVNLIGLMMNRPDEGEKGAFLSFADAYMNSLGLKSVPIGRACSDAGMFGGDVFSPYWTLVGEALPLSGRDLAAVPDAVSLYRRLLAESDDGSVVICSLGFLCNLRGLLASGPDGVSELSGGALVAAKVRELRLMAGCFDGSIERACGRGEYNVIGDVNSARVVLEKWPTPIVCTPWEMGMKFRYDAEAVLEDFPEGCRNRAIREAFLRWPDKDVNRLWDALVLMPIAEGDDLTPLSAPGAVRVAADDSGTTCFAPRADGLFRYQVASAFNGDRMLKRLRSVFRT